MVWENKQFASKLHSEIYILFPPYRIMNLFIRNGQRHKLFSAVEIKIAVETKRSKIVITSGGWGMHGGWNSTETHQMIKNDGVF